MGLRPSFFLDVGSVWGVKRPQLLGSARNTSPNVTVIFSDTNADGKLDPIVRPITDTGGNALYTVVDTTSADIGKSTTCVTGYSGTAGGTCVGSFANTALANTINPFEEFYFGDTWKPRLSVGFGVNWNSPFGPFRIDIAKALLKEPGDDTKLITFNVGTQF
jgi:outer membrane protein insertion porin family